MAKVEPQRLIFGLFLIILIAVGEVFFDHFKLPAWPAFMVMILFFMEHMNVQKVPHILIGGLVGIACIILIKMFVTSLAPVLGVEVAKIIFILAVVYAIVVFGEILPQVFNNFAFMFFVVCGIAGLLPNPNPFLWMAIEVVGGSVFIAGIVGIGKIMAAMAQKKAAQAK
jgi:hypothetical protein